MDCKSRPGSAATASFFCFSELLILILVLTLGATSAHAQTVTFTGAQSAITSFTDSISPIAVDKAGNIYTVASSGSTFQLMKIQPSGNQITLNASFPFSPQAIGVDPAGTVLYFIHYGASCKGRDSIINEYVARWTISGNSATSSTNETCAITSFAGWDLAAYTNPLDVKVNASGRAYIADFGAGVFWTIPPGSTMPDGFLSLTIGQPYDLALSSDGNTVYFTYMDYRNSSKNTIASVPSSQFGSSFSNAINPTNLVAGVPSIQSGLVVDYSGVLYIGGTDSNGDSVVFKVSGGALTPVTPPASNSSLYSFGVDSNGKLYTSGINSSGNPAISTSSFTGIGIGSTNIGWTSASANLKFYFNSAGTLGSINVLDQGSSGLEFRDAGTGTCKAMTAFNAGDTCTVNVTFAPAYAGLRQGAVVLKNAGGTAIATVYVYGNGAGPQVAFSPANETAIGGLQFPYGVAVDAVGNVFIVDSNNNRVLKETPSGAGYTETVITTNVSNPTGVAIDGAGNLYIADSAHNRVLKETPNGSGYTESTLGTGLSSPTGVAVDGSGNVYIADKGNNRVLKETYSTSGYGQSEVVKNLNSPTGVAVDDIGTVYIADSGNTRVIKETPSGASYTESVVANASNSLVNPTGIALSGVKHVYIADRGGSRIVKAVPAGSNYTVTTVADASTSGLVNPTGVAVGGNGTVYIADENNNRIVKQDVVSPSFDFGTTTVGVATSAKTATVTNIGNATLTFNVPSAGTNPSVSTNFILGASTCPQLTPTSSSASLAIGGSCTYALSFNPTTWGNISGALSMMDNALPSPQAIALKGMGAAPIDIFPATLADGTFDTAYNATFTASGGTAPYTFAFDSGRLPSGVTIASDGTLSGTPSTPGVFNFTVAVKDAVNAINTKNYTLVVAKASATITLNNLNQTYTGSALAPAATTTPAGLSVAFSYTKGGVPVAAPISAGSYAVTATINDSNYQGSTTGTLVIDKGTATVTLGGLSQTYNGSARSASATTTPVGLTLQFTYDGNATAPTNAGTYAVVATINDANYQGTASGTLVINKATATVTLVGLSQTYNGTARPVSTTTTPSGLTVNLTYEGSVTAPTNAGTYTVVGTINDSNYQGSATGNLVVAKAPATVTLSSLSLSQTYTGSALAATATTNPAGLTVVYSYAQGGTPVASPIGAGSYAVTATIDDTNYQGTVMGTLVVAKASATVALGNLDQTYTGSPLVPTATTTPAGLSVTFTYNGLGVAPVNAGNYAVVGTINNANYQGSASGTLVVGKAGATVALANLSQTYTGSPLTAAATTTPNGLTVNFTYDGSGTAPTNAGSYTVVGTINDGNYQGSATGTLVIGKASATVVLGSISQTYDGSPRVASATTTPSGLTVNFTYEGSATAPKNAGSYAVVGTVNDSNYQGSASGTLVVGKAPATVALASLNQTYTGSARVVSATTTPSGLTVDLAYDGSATAPVGAGSYTVVGTINDTNYQGTSNGTLVVAKAVATVEFGNLNQTYTGSALSPSATTTPAGLKVEFTYGGSSTAPSNTGSYSVVGTINDANHQGSGNATLVIGKAALTVTPSNASMNYGSSATNLTGTITGVAATDGITVNYATNATSTSIVGDYEITASLNDPNSKLANYEVSLRKGTMTVTPAPLSVTANNASTTFNAEIPTFTGTVSGVLNNDQITAAYSSTATRGSNAGTYAITPTLAATPAVLANYALSYTPGTLTIEKAPGTAAALTSSATTYYFGQSLTFTATVSNSVGTPDGSVSFYDGSTLLGSVALTNGTASYLSSNLTAGTHSVTAVYAGSDNYAGATSSALSQVVRSAAVSIQDSSTTGSIGTITVVQGGTGSTQFRIASLGTLNSAISLTCAVPAGIDCQLSPSTINVSGLPATVTVTVSTTKYKMAASNVENRGITRLALSLALFLPGIVIVSRKRKLGIAVLASLILALVLCMSACGGGAGVTNASSVIPAGTYTGTITATSTGSTSTTSNLTVVVQ